MERSTSCLSEETLAEEYTGYQDKIGKLIAEVDSLSKTSSELSDELKLLSPELEVLKREKRKLKSDVEIQTNRVREMESKLKEAGEVMSSLCKETKELQRKKNKLSSEVNSKEEALIKLKEIGLSEEDLLRLRAFIERISQNLNTDVSQVKEDFFSAIALYKDISSLEQRKKTEAERIRELAKEKSILSGEIKGLEERKGVLLGEIDNGIISTSQKLKAIGEEATSQLEQQVTGIKNKFDNLLTEAVNTGEALGQMKKMIKEGETSEKSLRSFFLEARNRLEGNQS
jgi:chromosome segregation ATPase